MENAVLFWLLAVPFLGAAAVCLPALREEKRRILAADLTAALEFAGCFLVFILFYLLRSGGFRQMNASCGGFGMGLHLCLDGFRALYCLIAAFMWLIATLFLREYFARAFHKGRFYFFWLMTLGATIGVFLSADLYTTFLFFEIMSFASYAWVAHDETPGALRAAETYLAVAVTGGLVMLMGLFLLYDMFGTLNISELSRRAVSLRAICTKPAAGDEPEGISMTRLYAAGGCLLFGFGAKAGAFPLHIWLPKAHPVAPAPASALLSGILTKAGIFGIIAVTSSLFLYDGKWGALVLAAGTVTMVLGAVLALFSVDLKRTLACSSVSQIGFILVGVGMMVLLGTGNGVAARGTLLHMVNHSLFKLVLFLSAGVVYMRTHRLDLNGIRGFGKGKPLFAFVFGMGALGICGVPLFSGYVSKTLLHEALVQYQTMARAGSRVIAGNGVIAFFTSASWVNVVEWLFLISGGFTVAYMLKLFSALFLEKNADAGLQAQYDGMNGSFWDRRSRIALLIAALPIPAMGLLAHPFMDRIASLGEGFLGSSGMAERVSYLSLSNLQGAAISLGIGVLLYLGVVRTFLMKREGEHRIYVNRWPAWLDLEELFYRPLLCTVFPLTAGTLARVLDRLPDTCILLLRRTVFRDSPIPHELKEGNWASHSLGSLADGTGRIFHKKTDYEHRLALLYENYSENSVLIGRSLSFGLFLACIGLLLTLLYLLAG